MRKTKKKELNFKYKIVISLFLGFLFTLLLGIVMALLSIYIDLPYKYTSYGGFLLTLFYSYSTAYILGKLNKKNGMECAFIIFACITILLLFFSLFIFKINLNLTLIIKLISVFILAQIGAILGVNAKTKYY